MDERGELLLSAGFEGGVETTAAFNAFWTRVPRALEDLFQGAARDAVEALGMRWGKEGMAVNILMKDFRVQNLNRGGGPVHFIAYGLFETSLKSGDGQDLRTDNFRFTDYAIATTSPDDALSALCARAASEATVRILLSFFSRKADPEAVEKLLAALDSGDPALRGRAAFWLGLVGGSEAAPKLLAAFRREENPAVSAALAASLGRIRSPEGREEIAGVLAGRSKLKGRDPTRMEDAWSLIHALALSGDRDLESKIPAVRDLRGRLADLVRFELTGQPPIRTTAEVEGRARCMEWITGKK